MTPARIFALLIGIDSYKSGNIWNLHSCVEDAKKMKQWLLNDFNVGNDHICMLLDAEATKSNIEKYFKEHLLCNPSIERGDAMFIYFAGHGSVVPAPQNWYRSDMQAQTVEVLCTYDQDTKCASGRVPGISDRSWHAMLDELSLSKGDNISVFLDCCFSPTLPMERSATRWTKTYKASADDLCHNLWPSGRTNTQDVSGFSSHLASHVTLAAVPPGGRSTETKDGGRFTSSFLHTVSNLQLYRTTYADIIARLQTNEENGPTCSGRFADRIVFNGVPFSVDANYMPACVDEETGLIKITTGSICTITKGTVLSLHFHNYQYSRNPSIATAIVCDSLDLLCYARVRETSLTLAIPSTLWVKIVRPRVQKPRSNDESLFTSFIQIRKAQRGPPRPKTITINQFSHVKECKHEELSLSIRTSYIPSKQHSLKSVVSSVEASGVRTTSQDNPDVHITPCLNLSIFHPQFVRRLVYKLCR